MAACRWLLIVLCTFASLAQADTSHARQNRAGQ